MHLRVLLAAALLAVASAAVPVAPPSETRVVPPLADPAVEPGIGRCTSDGVCTVTDAAGTRPAASWLSR